MNEHIFIPYLCRFIPYFCNPAIPKRMSHDLFSSIHTCVSVKAVKLGVTFLKSYFQDEKCSEIRRWTETGKSRNRVKEGSRDKCVLFLLLLQMNQLLLKFSCVCLCVCVYHVWYVLIFSCACGLIRIYELSVLTATALLLVTTNVIGKQQAIDPSSILPHFFDWTEVGYFYVIEFFLPSSWQISRFVLIHLSFFFLSRSLAPRVCADSNAAI